MRKRDIILIIIFSLFFTVSIGAKYYKFFTQNNYDLLLETSCEPESESCFVYECNYPEDEECEPYKYIEIKAYDFIQNDLEDEEYGLQCTDVDAPCTVIQCSPEETIEGETCLPRQYETL